MYHPLSKKQLWRRTTKPRFNKQHDFLYQNGVTGNSEVVSRSQSLPTVGTVFDNFYGLAQNLWATTGNLRQLEDQKQSLSHRKNKKVSFRNTVKILLIPDRAEYQSIDVANQIWFEESDYSAFKQSAILELKAIMASRKFNSKQAQEALYQPGFHIDIDMDVTMVGTTSPTSIPSHPLIFGDSDVNKANNVVSPTTNAAQKDDDDDQKQK